MKTIIKKELGDHFASVRFLILLALIFMVGLVTTHLAGENIKAALAQGAGPMLSGRLFLLIFTAPAGWFSLKSFLALFGPLMSLMLGFDVINREKNQGTLSKILAQPIRRDEVILGKFLAGLITITIMVSALFLLTAAQGLASVGLVPSGEDVSRLLIFWLITLVYLGFWLVVAVLLSILCRSVTTSALASGALWLFFTFFVTILASGLVEVLRPLDNPADLPQVQAREDIYQLTMMISPMNIYSETSRILLDPLSRGNEESQEDRLSQLDLHLMNRFQGPLSLDQSILLVMPHLMLLLGLSALVFWFSYLAFMRQEIRP